MKHTPCQDPLFIGCACYMRLDYIACKMNMVQSVIEREDGQMEITTRNTVYVADFSSQRVKQCFISQCKERELL